MLEAVHTDVGFHFYFNSGEYREARGSSESGLCLRSSKSRPWCRELISNFEEFPCGPQFRSLQLLVPATPGVKCETYLLAGIAAAGDYGNSADLEELHFRFAVVMLWLVWSSSSGKSRRMGSFSCENGGGCNWPRFCLCCGWVAEFLVCAQITECAHPVINGVDKLFLSIILISVPL